MSANSKRSRAPQSTTTSAPAAKKKTRNEIAIQGGIEAELGALPDLLTLRNSVGKAHYVNEKTGKTYHVPFGLGVGSPDIVFQLAPLGRWLAMEVKDPDGVVEPHQEASHAVWRRFGALVYVVRSVADARYALADARLQTRADVLRVAAQYRAEMAASPLPTTPTIHVATKAT